MFTELINLQLSGWGNNLLRIGLIIFSAWLVLGLLVCL